MFTTTTDSHIETHLHDLRGGPEGIKRWNARPEDECLAAGPFREMDFHHADLRRACLTGLDFAGSCFENANLSGAWLLECDLSGAALQRAKLDGCWLASSVLRQADLRGASLMKANLRTSDCRGAILAACNLAMAVFDGADLCGADLSESRLDGASFRKARYDAATKFPPGFEPRDVLDWVGTGTPPIAFDLFVKNLGTYLDPKRVARAVEMLKAERFQLYSRVEEGSILGVVKSQFDPEKVYSCRLQSDGRFACVDHHLDECMGMRGALCKHLMLLMIGLTRSGQAATAEVDQWARASRLKKPAIDEVALSEALLSYKAAQAGEIDWRPTETIPEDYYAL